jgi:hypothetical protein
MERTTNPSRSVAAMNRRFGFLRCILGCRWPVVSLLLIKVGRERAGDHDAGNANTTSLVQVLRSGTHLTIIHANGRGFATEREYEPSENTANG